MVVDKEIQTDEVRPALISTISSEAKPPVPRPNNNPNKLDKFRKSFDTPRESEQQQQNTPSVQISEVESAAEEDRIVRRHNSTSQV